MHKTAISAKPTIGILASCPAAWGGNPVHGGWDAGMKIPIGIYGDTYSVHQHLEIDSFQNTFVDGVSGAGKSTFVDDVTILSKLSPALNKIAPFARPVARTIFGQTDSLDLIKLTDEGYIILVDLDKGKIGEINAALIGSAILAHIQSKMFERLWVKAE